MYRKIKERAYHILEGGGRDDLLSKALNVFLVALIVLNVLSVILETVESFYASYADVIWWFEVFSVAVFTVEYAARLWVCNLNPKYPGIVAGRLRYLFSAMALIDFLAIIPFYVPMLIPLDLRFLRALRLFRLFRLFKLSRYSDSMQMLGRIVRNRKEDLIITMFIVAIILILSSALIYYAEHDAQPEKFDSIPSSMYWGVITLATVGYGDIYPVTPLGRFFSAVIALAGIALFALPAGIIGSSFIEERQKVREKAMEQEITTDVEKTLEQDIEKVLKHDRDLDRDDICPHCGKSRHEPVAGKIAPVVPRTKK